MELNTDMAKMVPWNGVLDEIPGTVQVWFKVPVEILSIKNLFTNEYVRSTGWTLNVFTEEEAPRAMQSLRETKYLDPDTGIEVSWYDTTYHILEFKTMLGGKVFGNFELKYYVDGEIKVYHFSLSYNNS